MTHTISTTAARILTNIRETQGITALDVAKTTGLKRETIRLTLLGKRPFTLDEFTLICRALRVSPIDIYTQARDITINPTPPNDEPATRIIKGQIQIIDNNGNVIAHTNSSGQLVINHAH